MTSKKEYQRRIEQGLCVKCSDDLNGSPYARCLPCHESFKKSRETRRNNRSAKGICVLCEQPAAPSPNGGLLKYCENCLANRKQDYLDHKNSGTCADCGQLAKGVRCQSCAAKRTIVPIREKLLSFWGNVCSVCQGSTNLNLLPTEEASEAIRNLRGEKLFRSIIDGNSLRVSKSHCRIICNSCYREETLSWHDKVWSLYKPVKSDTDEE